MLNHKFLNIQIRQFLLSLIILIAFFLRAYRLEDLMPFFGDIGWFYLSARDTILSGRIPLVGITASHTWLHQGPLWTYILSVLLFVFKFNPLSGAYFTSLIGVITVWLVYKVASLFFSERVGLISAFLYAASPLVIIHSRMAYHTSLIPTFVLIFTFALYKWLKGNGKVFSLIILSLAILYNLELATVALLFVFLIIFAFGLFKKKKWINKILVPKILMQSFFAFFFVMLPIFIYDLGHGFPQTLKFIAWFPYRISKILLPVFSNGTFESSDSIFSFIYVYFQRLIFLPSSIFSFLLVLLTTGFICGIICKNLKARKESLNYILIFLLVFIPLGSFLLNQVASEAYLPIIFPTIFIFIALLLDKLMKITFLKIPTIFVLVFIVVANIFSLIKSEYLIETYGPSFKERVKISNEIINKADGKSYNLVGRGEGSQFESFTMNYQYLTWWLGNEPSFKNQKLKFIIEETDNVRVKVVEK